MMTRWILLSLMLVSLAGCGYTLRVPATIDTGLQPVALVTQEKFSEIYRAMEQVLRSNAIEVTDSVALAQSRIEISNENEPERETITITDAGEEQLFILQWQFRFLERDAEESTLWNTALPNQFIRATKIVNKDQLEQQIGETYDSVRQQLRQELAEKIIQQINNYRLQLQL